MAKHESRKGNLWSWLIIGVLGVLLIVGQQLVKNVLYMVMAAGLILAAAAHLVSWWRYRDKSMDSVAHLLGDVVLIAIGAWILFNPGRFDDLINVLIGLVLIACGLIWIVRGWRLGRDWVIIALAAVAVVFGLVIACSNAATGWPIVVEGVAMVYAAVGGIIAELRAKR